MANLKDQFYSAPTRIQDGVLFIILEAAIYLTMAFVDLFHDHHVANFSPALSFALVLVLIIVITLCGLGILYGMKEGWIGSLIMSIFLMVIGALFMLDVIELTLVLSGLFYFIFGAISFVELLRKDFRVYCKIGQE